ncbi:hypothetical protein C8F04DRAFT_954550 [Mycena alexandri]|uniref:Uncharacterized protein n=1 Tax=Mycena alexandri TaxID=1745969 RepID=A0AAD6X8B9_9AGAR|nr:hypothetical protein C8F04DRAFT_954550 [Mycena alexandri]
MPAPPTFLSWVDANTDAFISRLSHAAAIPSMSGDPAFRPRVQEMNDWLNAELKKVGVETKCPTGSTSSTKSTWRPSRSTWAVMDGQTLPLPNAILGRIGNAKDSDKS